MKKVLILFFCLVLSLSSIHALGNQTVLAESEITVTSITTAKKLDDNTVELTFQNGLKARLTFLEDDIFRYNIDPSGSFTQYAQANSASHTATIQAQADDSNKYSHPAVQLTSTADGVTVETAKIVITFDKQSAKMTIKDKHDKVILQESETITLGTKTVQHLVSTANEHFFGSGTQNGRFTHRGKTINIANESSWTDGGVASPNPFYWSSNGYGVLRNTFKPGSYSFALDGTTVTTQHNENEFDAYYFVSTKDSVNGIAKDILTQYYKVTGNPTLLPEYAFYLAHLNCYNRDAWSASTNNRGWLLEDGNRYLEHGQRTGYVIPEGMYAESLNNTAPTTDIEQFRGVLNEDSYKYSARAVIDGHVANDIPLGWFLPNDGYGCGYGQNGYYQRRSANEDKSRMIAAIDANIENLKQFTAYAEQYGVRSGLWTQAALTPETSEQDRGYQGFHTLRDFNKEVTVAGVSALKTDVAWVGHGYSMALNSVKDGYNTLILADKRPTVVSLDGWAGFQRYASVWTGDQKGGNWEYIRFHIPTYIGQSLSGNPNIGSDVDGIFGGSNLITTRDLQFKTFTQTMLDMDGWGALPKKPYISGDPYTGTNRMYLKLKAELMPYIYTTAHESVDGLPMIRAMFLEEANDYTYSTATQYQFMFGDQFLVAPIYQNTNMQDNGDDIRNDIYLPNTASSWIDYFTGKHYEAGKIVNNFDAPLWKLPLFVKNGSIIPMYEENNNPMPISATNTKGLDKTRRVIEFYPDGNTEYQLIEDDGISINPETLSYGDRVTTRMTSSVEGDVATLTIHPSVGTYNGYQAQRHTNMVVNVSKKPTALEAKNGEVTLNLQEVTSLAEFQQKAKNNEAVWFYDEHPNLNKYSKDDEGFKNTIIQTSPKVYVSFNQTNVNELAQTLIVQGFENAKNFDKDVLNQDLATVSNLQAEEGQKTPTSIRLTWDEVADATSYEVEADGIINSVGNQTTFHHTGLQYHSQHSYRVRAKNSEGYSQWSTLLTTYSLEDPYRNIIPARITWEGGDNWGKLRFATDRDLNTMFHSTAGNVVRDQIPFIFDLEQGYQLDKLEYFPRDNYGNGTVERMDVFTSLDGVHWKKVHDGQQHRWTYQSGLSVSENKKIVDLDGNQARFVKLEIKSSVGGFFSANELLLHKKENTKSFAVGSISIQSRDLVDENDLTNLMNYLGLSEKDNPTFDNQVKNYSLDINQNGIYDVYDYAFTAFKLNGGTKKTGAVGGNILLLKNKETVQAEDTLTVDVYADQVENLNAFGEVLHYNPEVLEFVSLDVSPKVMQMTNFSVNKVYSDQTAYYNLAFANVGDQALYSGSGVLATITFKAKAEATVDENTLDLSKIRLIGPDYRFFDSVAETAVDIPNIPSTSTRIYSKESFTITMTNDELTTDDGTNVNRLIQQNSYDPLFNGTFGREFEFKWDWQGNYVEGKLPSYVKLPTTLHFNFNQASKLDTVSVFNGAAGSNGGVTSIKAKAFFEDGSESEEIVINQHQNEFVFNFQSDKKVVKVDITPMTSTGTTSTDEAENRNNRMLTLAEVQFKVTEGTAVESIQLGDNPTQVYKSSLTTVSAQVLPLEATNQFYTVASSNTDVAKIIVLSDENNHPVYRLHALKEGETTITVSSAADPTIQASYQVIVEAGFDKSELKQLLDDYKMLSSTVYTEDTFTAFQEAYQQALVVYQAEDASLPSIEQAIQQLKAAVHALQYKEVSEELKLDTTMIQEPNALYSESNVAGKAFDKQLNSYWESPYYGANANLPQEFIFSLAEPHLLEKVAITSHTVRNGGVLSYEVQVKTEDGQWRTVFTGKAEKDVYLKNQNVTLNAIFEAVQTQEVKLIFKQSVGRIESENNKYVRVAEIEVYGTKVQNIQTQALQELIELHQNKEQGSYTDDSWNNFSTALEAAKDVLADPQSQERVDQAKAALETAVQGLTVAVTELEEVVYTADTMDASVTSIANRLPKDLKLVVEETQVSVADAKGFEVHFVDPTTNQVYPVTEGDFVVKLPYIQGKQPDYVLHIAEGIQERIAIEKIDETHVYFKTNHFSVYAIVYKTKAVTPVVSTPTNTVSATPLPRTGVNQSYGVGMLLLAATYFVWKRYTDK